MNGSVMVIPHEYYEKSRFLYLPAISAVRMVIGLFIGLVFQSHISGAQSEMGLGECLDFALVHSPALSNELINQAEQDAQFRAERKDYLPDINAYMRYRHYFSDRAGLCISRAGRKHSFGGNSDGPYPVQLGLPHNMNAGIILNQVIFDNNFFLLSKISPEKEKLNAINMEKVRAELIFNISTQYFQVAANKEKLLIFDYNLERLARLEKMVSLQVENEFAIKSELLKIRVKAFSLANERERLVSGIKLQEDYMKMMMGMAGDDTLLLNTAGEAVVLNGVSEMTPSTGLIDNRILEQQQVLLELQERKIRSDHLPTLSAVANLNFQAQRERWNLLSTGYPWYNIHYWGLTLDIPIMHGFSKKDQLQLSSLRNKRIQLGIDQNVKKQHLEYEQALRELEYINQTLEGYRTHLQLAEQLYTEAELKYREGTLMLQDLLETESLLTESKVNYTSQLFQVKIAELNVLKTTGSLEELVNGN